MNTHRFAPDYTKLLHFFSMQAKGSGSVEVCDGTVTLDYALNIGDDADNPVEGYFANLIDKEGKQEYLVGVAMDTPESMADEVYFALPQI